MVGNEIQWETMGDKGSDLATCILACPGSFGMVTYLTLYKDQMVASLISIGNRRRRREKVGCLVTTLVAMPGKLWIMVTISAVQEMDGCRTCVYGDRKNFGFLISKLRI